MAISRPYRITVKPGKKNEQFFSGNTPRFIEGKAYDVLEREVTGGLAQLLIIDERGDFTYVKPEDSRFAGYQDGGTAGANGIPGDVPVGTTAVSVGAGKDEGEDKGDSHRAGTTHGAKGGKSDSKAAGADKD